MNLKPGKCNSAVGIVAFILVYAIYFISQNFISGGLVNPPKPISQEIIIAISLIVGIIAYIIASLCCGSGCCCCKEKNEKKAHLKESVFGSLKPTKKNITVATVFFAVALISLNFVATCTNGPCISNLLPNIAISILFGVMGYLAVCWPTGG